MAEQKKKKKVGYMQNILDNLPNAAGNQASWNKAANIYNNEGIVAAAGSYIHDLPKNLYNTAKDAGDQYLGLEDMGNKMIDFATTAYTGKSPSEQKLAGAHLTARDNSLTSLEDRGRKYNGRSGVMSPTDYGSGLLAENRYDESIKTSTTGGAGRDMRTTLSIGNNTMSYAGGPRQLKGGTGGGSNSGGMYPHGRTTPRGGGGRRLKRGETLMAPAESSKTEGGSGDLSQLISKEQAKEMGLGVNQWRALNERILSNQGNIAQQEVANQGAITLGNIKSATDLQELFAKQTDPQAKAQLATMLADLDLAPLRKSLMQSQADYFTKDTDSKKKKSVNVFDEIDQARTQLGFMRP